MQKLNTKVTNELNFFQDNNPFDIIEKFGSPLYVYNERILRERCRDIKNLVTYKNFKVNYAAKANSNLALLQIMKQEGLNVDAISPGEVIVLLAAGFNAENIFYVCNNVSDEEMKFVIEHKILMSADSISQLERYGRLNPGGKVAVRFNPGVGDGHHTKVVTGGKNTKFGANSEDIPQIKAVLDKYNLTLCGINQHIGSLFMEGDNYIDGVKALLEIAKQFEGLEFVDMGGGFGIPYHKQEDQKRLDLKDLGERLDAVIHDFAKTYGREITIKVEPGRYISAESSVLLGNVNAVKYNYDNKYIGTDLGFNVLARPVMYDSYHEIEIYRNSGTESVKSEKVSIVGNICESGDIIAKDRTLPEIFEGDILGVLDAGAYGYAMSSNYNNRLRPAEVLIRENNEVVLIRERDTFEDLTRHFIALQ